MTKFEDHPTVKRLRALQNSQSENSSDEIPTPLDRDW